VNQTVRHRVPGRWHPEVDINAIHIDSEPTHGVTTDRDEMGRKRGDLYRKVSAEMGALIRNQEMCWRCLQEFPCPMKSGERVSIWNEAITRGEFRCGGVITPVLVLERVANRHCPMCGVPVSDVAVSRQVRMERADEKSQA
jgi:hypothetical protein